MRKGTIITTSIIGGVLATALVAGGSFALGTGINDNPSSPNGTSQAAGRGPHSPGMVQGMQHGQGSSGEMMDGLDGLASGTLSSEQEATLEYQAEEEKLSHDLYIAFGDLYGDDVFDRIASAETKHLSAVRSLLERYDLVDPTAEQEIGTFSSESVQKLYDSFLAQGSASLEGAYDAARSVESDDISFLIAATEGMTAPDVLAVYGHVLTASQHHLAAFGG